LSEGDRMVEEATPTAKGRDWGLALALSFTFCAVILAGWSIPAHRTAWAFWALIISAYVFLALGFLGAYVDVNRLLAGFSVGFRRVVNLLVTLLAVAVSTLSFLFLGGHAAARWVFGALLAVETVAGLIFIGGIGQSLTTRARNYVFAFIPTIIAGFFFLGWFLLDDWAARIPMGVFSALSLIVAAVYLAMGFQVSVERSTAGRTTDVPRPKPQSDGARLGQFGRRVQRVAAFVAFLLGVAAAIATIYAAFAQSNP
jgi:hypothetical protein